MEKTQRLKKIIALAGDIIVFYLSLYLALAARYMEKPTLVLWHDHFWPFTVIFAAWIIIFYITGLYNLHLAANNARFFQMTNKGVISAVIIALVFFYATPQVAIAPKTNLFVYVLVFYALFFLWRRIFNILLKTYLPKKKLAVIGYDEQVKKLIADLGAKPHLGYIIPFIIDDNKEAPETIDGIKVESSVKELKSLVLDHGISTIVINADPHQSPDLRAALFDCLPLKISYLSLPNFYETITGKVPIETISQMWFLENLSEGNKAWFDAVKRTYDIVLSLSILFITGIFWPLIALAIRLESKGPAFFTQTRGGKNNTPFKLIKFRTMREEGNDRSLTTSGDSRITKFGNFLRKSRIDELPQLINVLTGDMSFVGPRPERPEYIAELEKSIPFYKERMLVKPGLTGWDQVSGEYHSPSLEDSVKKLQYDLFYIKNRSIYLDLSIILKTIMTVLSRSGL